MRSRNKKHEKRIKKLIVVCSLCAIILTVSTYAWFIGMKTVNVSPFEVKIAAIDSLALSLDGVSWSESVEINQTNYNDEDHTYAGNTNSWGGEDGLVPMSSIGKIDPTTSRMVLFEKGSLTTTKGGYRLMASKVDNSAAEQRGYVAFDLFIRNQSGRAYYTEYNELNEEAIYLTLDSAVTHSLSGKEGTGIENSVRVAFAQIGRVIATTTDQNLITGIDCNANNVTTETGYDEKVTGICQRDAQIWEPNDTKHVQNAINWYNTSCTKRKATPVAEDDSYEGVCGTITDGATYPTYAVSGVIDYSDNVDVYDGTPYNSWEYTTAADATEGKLVSYDYFTDTEKELEGVNRPKFMNLAPNSITKVRIYIYIEGQDVDNYDFASLGEQITVNFGFTKERFFGEDVSYDDTDTATLPDDVVRGTR